MHAPSASLGMVAMLLRPLCALALFVATLSSAHAAASDPAGIDDAKIVPTPVRFTVQAVARDPGLVAHNGAS